MVSVKSPTRFAVIAALMTLTACSSGGHGSTTSSSPATSGDQLLLSIGRQYSQCVRAHGVSAYPDMVIIGGFLTLPDSPAGDAGDQALRANPSARDGCAPI